jgi:hypothetical protein
MPAYYGAWFDSQGRLLLYRNIIGHIYKVDLDGGGAVD